jgi:alanine-alpha-ketoisovalerate/valine-pyruvate aminotransferase
MSCHSMLAWRWCQMFIFQRCQVQVKLAMVGLIRFGNNIYTIIFLTKDIYLLWQKNLIATKTLSKQYIPGNILHIRNKPIIKTYPALQGVYSPNRRTVTDRYF